MKDCFAMSRHERRGALAVLLMIAFVLLVMWFGRTQKHQPDTDALAKIKQMEALADTLEQSEKVNTKKEKLKSDHARKSSNKKNNPKGRQSQHRPMDPVPQF